MMCPQAKAKPSAKRYCLGHHHDVLLKEEIRNPLVRPTDGEPKDGVNPKMYSMNPAAAANGSVRSTRPLASSCSDSWNDTSLCSSSLLSPIAPAACQTSLCVKSLGE